MAEIPRAALDFVTKEVGALSDDAKEKVSRLLGSIEWGSDNIAECRALLVDALLSLMPTYTDAAAQAGADFYDAVRYREKGRAIGALAISGFDSEAFEGAVRAFVQDVVDGEPAERFNSKVIDRVDRDIRRSANMSVAENARLDPLRPKFARVPSGAETCSFCLMLASRGAVYGTAEAASHSHPGCDCRVVPDWGDGIEGYDPEELYFELKGREKCRIPEAKLIGYSLNMNHPKGRDKAIAFREALGFTDEDAPEIMRQVYRWVGEHEPNFRDSTQYGDRYTADIPMRGANGKTANVRTGWMLDPGATIMRLTSIYVH